jgi:uncharacterized protein YecA (UPF0149 family)
MTTKPNLKKIRDQLIAFGIKVEGALRDADFHIRSLSNGARLETVQNALADLVKLFDATEQFYAVAQQVTTKKKVVKRKKVGKKTVRRGKK